MQKLLFEPENFDEEKPVKNLVTPGDSTKNIFNEMQTLIEKKESLAKHRKRKVKYD